MTFQSTLTLGGTASDVKVARIAHGLMLMTWTPTPVSDEVCFEAIKTGIESLPPDVKILLNSAEFYAADFGTANLEMLARFFDKYPQYADRTFLSVKGGMKEKTLQVDSSPKNLRRSVTAAITALRGTKRIDLFESARVDPKIPVEETVRALKSFVHEGLFDHIGLSECSAETLRRAHSVHPIAAVEIEVSPWCIEEEGQKVISTAHELDVAVIAYSPLGQGFLTGSIKSIDDLPEGDLRRNYTRFQQEEYFQYNMALVDALKAIALKKQITSAALCLAWVASLGPKVIPLPGSTNPERTAQNVAAGDIVLTAEERAEVWKIITGHEVKGGRYFTGSLHLWG